MTANTPYRAPWKPKGPACPRCGPARGTLQKERIGDNYVDRCEACKGVWVTAHDFNEIVVDIDRQEQILADAHLARQGLSGKRAVACPTCADPLRRANFGRRSGILVDSCRKHGIWFDAGELRRVVEYLRIRARKYELERAEADELGLEEDVLDARIASALAEVRPQEETPLWKQVLDAFLQVIAGR